MVEAHAIDDPDLVAVLQVLADPRQLDAHGNAERVQHLARADARQHQELRRIESAAAQDHLSGGLGPGENARHRRRLAMGAVEALAFEVFDPGRAVLIIENDAGD